MSKRNKRMRDKLAPLGVIIWLTGAARFYHDGDGAGFVWRWWHPLAWLSAPIFFMLFCAASGVPSAWLNRHEAGFCVSPWFRENPSRLDWE